MGIVVTALVKYGDQGITIHGGIINIIIKGAKVAILIHNLPSLLSKNFLPFLWHSFTQLLWQNCKKFKIQNKTENDLIMQKKPPSLSHILLYGEYSHKKEWQCCQKIPNCATLLSRAAEPQYTIIAKYNLLVGCTISRNTYGSVGTPQKLHFAVVTPRASLSPPSDEPQIFHLKSIKFNGVIC